MHVNELSSMKLKIIFFPLLICLHDFYHYFDLTDKYVRNEISHDFI